MEDYIKLIGIDPGNNTGISILYIDPVTFLIKNIETRTVQLSRYSNDEYDYTRLYILQNVISDLYHQAQPNAVAMEVAFLNMRYPKAVIQLSQYVGVVETTFKLLDSTIIMYKYSPMYIKSIAGGSGKADKNDMRDAVSRNKELVRHLNLDTMTEHEIDATCIAYTALLDIRENQYVLLAIPS